MEKDYIAWTPVKTIIHKNRSVPIEYNEREIWLCSVGENIGFEEDGKGKEFVRPVIVLRRYNQFFCHVIPLSTTTNRGKYYFPFDGKTGKTSVALLTQSRAISSARLHGLIGIVKNEDFHAIKNRLKRLLGL